MLGLTQDRVTRLDGRRDFGRKAHGGLGAETDKPLAQDRPATILDFRQNSSVLVRTVEREVIPRLLVAHTASGASAIRSGPASANSADVPDRSEVLAFVGLIATRDVAAARKYIETRRAGGMSLESLYLHLLIPSARRLAELWDADLCHYEEIAVGMLQLQQVLHELGPAFSSEAQCRCRGRKALLVSAPAEQNMLGVFMVSEFFRCVASEFFYRAGWEVWRAPPASRAQMLDVVHAQWFDVIDLCASSTERLATLRLDIAEIRKVSLNRRVGVVVGGPVFSDHPELLESVGADAAATDSRDALSRAELLVERQERETSQPYY